MNTHKIALIGFSALSGLFAAFAPVSIGGEDAAAPIPGWTFEPRKLCDEVTATCKDASNAECAQDSAFIEIGGKIYSVYSCYNSKGGPKDDLGKVRVGKTEI